MRGGRAGGMAGVLGHLKLIEGGKKDDAPLELASKIDPEVQGPIIMAKKLRSQIASACAQMLKPYKKQWHRTGMVDFDLPRGAQLPPWMAVVLEELRRRKNWKVVTMGGLKGGTKYRVSWLWWGRCKGKRVFLGVDLGHGKDASVVVTTENGKVTKVEPVE